jgi:hypothetical protein
MFYDANAWPPAPGGPPPRPEPPRLTPVQERRLARLIAFFLLLMFVGPLAGSSVIVAIVSLLGS